MSVKTNNWFQTLERQTRVTFFLGVLGVLLYLLFGVDHWRNLPLKCAHPQNSTLQLDPLKWQFNTRQNGCSKNAVMLTGHLRTFNSTFPFLKEYIFDEGPYDVYWAGPDLTYAKLSGSDGDDYWKSLHSDKGTFTLDTDLKKVDLDLVNLITHGRLSGIGTYHQSMSDIKKYVKEQCLPPTFYAHYPNRTFGQQHATYLVPRTMASLYNIQEAAKFLSGQSCKYERILWTRPDMIPYFYFREPLTSNREVCGFNLPWTFMFDAAGNRRHERGEFCDMAFWTSMETVENTLVDTIEHALHAWRYSDVGVGHTESTLRHILEVTGGNTILKCSMFPFGIQRDNIDPPEQGFGYARTTAQHRIDPGQTNLTADGNIYKQD